MISERQEARGNRQQRQLHPWTFGPKGGTKILPYYIHIHINTHMIYICRGHAGASKRDKKNATTLPVPHTETKKKTWKKNHTNPNETRQHRHVGRNATWRRGRTSSFSFTRILLIQLKWKTQKPSNAQMVDCSTARMVGRRLVILVHLNTYNISR